MIRLVVPGRVLDSLTLIDTPGEFWVDTYQSVF
jgi:hypothetical protein